MDVIVTGGIGILTSIVSSWATWFFTRKKYNLEVGLMNVDKMDKSLEFYINLSDDTKNRLDESIKEQHELKEKNASLEREIQDLRKQVLDLTLNICMNFSCRHRVKEYSNEKSKSRTTKK